ncbi:2-C-methyl-D-erythritol 4-phosphate cytidylyltransferase [Gilvimarinus sp. DA14]|uniref:2-C-methyl-D-erythritol 4-phosphate cytidylyltransferase n=1 Tax=Gilvimarinus sp. DA14 TaxID=2956798 RepID=UPI0020B8D085|nr:2-C-methyl-D-erythritol 4-phosphate cytidylyltransferase [Gilvimarinus sp. DA14]UTF60135.1 2-C-methyl-D-erythritol 4-phosphate cytidylyltransferase [Gilvimarinus sp. DA14]
MSCDLFYAVVPAAGIGSRMAADMPKQYLPLAGSTVIEQTLKKLLSIPNIATIVVAISAHDTFWRNLSLSQHPRIQTVTGGAERAHSVLAALSHLQGQGLRGRVLVHDAARPCVRVADIERLMACAQGGILAAPVSDTLKKSGANGAIENTVSRQDLWSAFTPQMFELDGLLQALQGALDAGFEITDEASAMEWAGQRPELVEGHRDNIKITRPEDLLLANLILSQQLNKG